MLEEKQMDRLKNDVATIDLAEVFRAIWKQKVFVILLAVIVGAASFVVTRYIIQPTYRTTMTVFVNNRNGSTYNDTPVTSSDTTAAQSLTSTYAGILTSRELLTEAANQINLNASYSELKNMVNAEVVTDSQLIDLSVTMDDPNDAYDYAKALEKIAPNYMARAVEGSSMKIVSKSVRPKAPYSPSIPRNTAIGAILGLLIAIVIVVIQDLRDDRVKSSDELSARYDLPIMGTIPNFKEAADNRQSYYYAKRGA